MSTVRAELGPVATWFPPRVDLVAELPELASCSAARRQHALAVGVERVHNADELSEVDLAEPAAEQALQQAGLRAAELDALILVQGRAPRYLLASDATLLQARLGASRALTLGIGELGCVSVSAAITVGAALLRANPGYRTVLLATGSRTATPARYRSPMTILGDGGAAVLLTRAGHGAGRTRYELVDSELRSEGRYADLYRIDYRDPPQAQWVEECTDEVTYSFRLAVESRKRFDELNRDVLERNGIERGDLAAVLTQNLASGAFAFWRDALEMEIHPACRRNLAAYGHLGSIDILLNLESAAPTLPAGATVLVLNSSPVAAWSSTLLRRLPETAQ